MQPTLATPPRTTSAPAAARPSAAHILLRALGDRRVMAALTLLGLVIYLWHSLQAIDYPVYDEAIYFFRSQRLLAGDLRTAGVADVSSSPLYIVYYALWYLALHTSRLYPAIFVAATMLMGLGCYLLLSRLLHPALAWALALFAVIGAAPVVPQNGLYYTSAGLLWISLALLGKHPLRRGLAAFGVVVSVLLRPEYLGVALLLLALLAIYEWRQVRAQSGATSRLRRAAHIAPCYLPVLLMLLLIGVLAARLPNDAVRVDSAIPWSYNTYLAAERPAGYAGIDSLARPFVLFERDYGPVRPRTLPNILLAMARRPDLTVPYLGYESERLLAAFGSSTLTAWGYLYNGTPWAARLNVWNTWLFGLGVFELILLGWACAFDLKRRGLRASPLRHRDTPALLGIVSLVALVPWLLLINPQQRFWMTYPLVLLGAGWALSVIARWLALSMPRWLPAWPRSRALVAHWAPAASVLLLLVLLPHPWAGTRPQPNAATIAFIRQHVPEHSTIIGEPLFSFTDYLAGDGYPLDSLEATAFQPSPLVQAERYDPHLRYALLAPILPQTTYAAWFADWSRAYPGRNWVLVAQMTQPAVQLYALSDGPSAAVLPPPTTTVIACGNQRPSQGTISHNGSFARLSPVAASCASLVP